MNQLLPIRIVNLIISIQSYISTSCYLVLQGLKLFQKLALSQSYNGN